MKPKGVQVDVTSQRQGRAAGDPPALGQLNKVSDIEPAPLRRRRIQPEEPTNEKQAKADWLGPVGAVVGVLVALAVVAVSFYYTLIVKIRPPKERKKHVEAWVQEQPNPRIGEGGARKATHPLVQVDALDLVRRALATRFVSKITDYFRFGPRIEPTEIVKFLQAMEQRDGLVIGMELLEPLDLDGRQIGRVRVDYAHGDQTSSRTALLVKCADGEWRIDYESFAQIAEPSLASLMAGEVSVALVRVHIQPGGDNREGWSSYEIQSPELGPGKSLTASCLQGSPQDRALKSVKFEEGQPRRFTLQLRTLPDSDPVQWEIDQVVAIDWLVFQSAYDRRFR